MPTQPPKLLDRIRSACRRRGDSRRTVHEDSSWTSRFVRFHGTTTSLMRIDPTHSFVFPCNRNFGSDRLPFRILESRRNHLAELENLFLEVLQMSERMGRVERGNEVFDGTRVQASANKHKAMSYEQMLQEKERVKEKSQEMRERAETTGREEDERFDGRADETNSPKS
jgi:hypothetical protein